MDRKKTELARCKNCEMLPNEHNYGPYDDLLCEIDKLPLQIQEAYYKATREWEKLKSHIIYYPMDNLQVLEYEYEKTLRDAPTVRSLH